MKYLILFILAFESIQADSLDPYFSYLEKLHLSPGNHQKGEIEIVLDPTAITKVQQCQEQRLLKKGFSSSDAKEFSRIGIIAEDQYWIWLRDAVYFPKGVHGTYDRLIWKNSLINSPNGVAVLPILPSNKIVLNLNYRHATRSWELELPRGNKEPNETAEQAAFREVYEETGQIASSIIFLGEMAPDTGVLYSLVPVYLGKISSQEASNPDDSEAIHSLIAFTLDEIKEALLKGFVMITIEDKETKVPIRDPFLTFALFQAQLRDLL